MNYLQACRHKIRNATQGKPGGTQGKEILGFQVLSTQVDMNEPWLTKSLFLKDITIERLDHAGRKKAVYTYIYTYIHT